MCAENTEIHWKSFGKATSFCSLNTPFCISTVISLSLVALFCCKKFSSNVSGGGGGGERQGGRSPEEIMEIFLNTASSTDIMLSDKSIKYRKIPKISPRAYIFQRPSLRGLFLTRCLYWESLIYGGKFAFTY